MEEPIKAESNRQSDGTFGPGNNANPAGRPKGQTLKEYWRSRFAEMSDEERLAFSKEVAADVIWKMAEGMPQQDVTSDGKQLPTPIYGGISVQTNNGDKEVVSDEKENP